MQTTEMGRLQVLIPSYLRDAVNDYCERNPGDDGRSLSLGEFTRQSWREKLEREGRPEPPAVVQRFDEAQAGGKK